MYIFTLHVIFPLVPIQKSRALCDNCLVYSTSLVSNNYLVLNNCSVENNFHLLLKVLFPSALLFRLLSVWNIIQLRMSIFTLHVIFSLVPIQKSCALCDNCLVYSTSLVSNNYLGSNYCSVDNHFHFSSECLVSNCSSVYTTVCVKHYPVENVYLYTSRHFPPCSYSEKLCFVRLLSCPQYLSSFQQLSRFKQLFCFKTTFISLVNVLFPIALQFRLLSVWNIIQLRISIFTVNFIFPFAPLQKCCALCDNCLVHSTSLVSNNYLGSNNCSVENNFHLLVKVLFPSALLFRTLSVWNIYPV